jgi:hypothetical protein
MNLGTLASRGPPFYFGENLGAGLKSVGLFLAVYLGQCTAGAGRETRAFQRRFSSRQRAMAAWSPLKRISGTVRPR